MTKPTPDEELADILAGFYDDPLAYVMFAFPWDTEKSIQLVELPEEYQDRFSCKYGPDKWACDFLEDLGREIRDRGFDGRNAVMPIRFATVSGHGIGKALSKSLILNTVSGLKRWGDLKPGDLLFGSDGVPTRIKATRHYDSIPIYRVTFDDGSSTEVSSGHLWNVRGRQERRNNLEGWRTLETIDLLERGVKRKNGVALARQWEVPVQGAAQFEEREVDLHPYFVGVWLGDGSRGLPSFGKPYLEPEQRLNDFGYETTRSNDGMKVRVLGISHLLRDKVFDLYSYERYIPGDYKFNTIENRMELFRGLCDTDGEVHKSGSIGFSSTSKRLAEDMIWLARSLGCKAMMQPSVKEGRYRDSDGVMVGCRDCYRVTINAPFNPFSIAHKRDAYKPSEHRYLVRWIESIEYVRDDEGMCVEVEAEDGLYLANDFIVTHNSTLSAHIIKFIMDTRPYARGTVTATTDSQLRTKTWAELGKWHRMSLTEHWFDYTTGRGAMAFKHKEFPESWFCTAQTCREENSEAFAGQHAANSTSFYLFDEASGVPNKIYEVRSGGLTDGEPMVFDFGNGTRNSGEFFEECEGRLKERFRVRSIDSRDTALASKPYIEEMLADYGEDSDRFRVRIRGLFPKSGSVQFIGNDLVEAAQEREIVQDRTAPLVIGVDTARYGDDDTVIWARLGMDARSFPPRRFQKLDTNQVVGRVTALINEFADLGITYAGLFVDEGYNPGVLDNLRQLGYNAIGVNFGGRVTNPAYRYKGDEMWGDMKDALRSSLALPKRNSDTGELIYTQLTQREYGFTLQGEKIHLESKDDMKKRGLNSPDLADALALTFAQPVAYAMDGLPRRNSGRVKSEYDPLQEMA